MATTHDVLRLAIVVAGLLVFAGGRRLAIPWRRVLLVALALAALASYYNFFRFRHFGATKDGDSFTYYMGSKYFSELGYFRLYECTVAALVDLEMAASQDPRAPKVLRLPEVRDLETLGILEPAELLERSRRCRQGFAPERWRSFQSDVAWFHRHTHPGSWPRMLRDHGYHPSPAWTLIGGSLASLTEAGSDAFFNLIAADRLLAAAMLVAVLWAFGLETAALAAIVWGTGHLWSYAWIGDSYLRFLWLAAAISGLCFARRKHWFVSGLLISLAAMLRLFPAVFALAVLVHAGRRAWRERRVPASARRFAAGLALGALALAAAGAVTSGRGIDDYREFADKIGVFAGTEFSNTVGLPVLARELAAVGGSPGWWLVVQGARLAVVALFLWLVWRRLPRLAAWEAAALGFALIPILAAPANYYHSFVIAGLLLASRRRRIGTLLLAAAAAWLAVGILLPDLLSPGQRVLDSLAASLVAVVLAFLVVRETGRPPDPPVAARASAPPPRTSR